MTDCVRRTLLRVATRGGNRHVVSALLEYAGWQITDADKANAREAARKNKHLEIVDLLK